MGQYCTVNFFFSVKVFFVYKTEVFFQINLNNGCIVSIKFLPIESFVNQT